MGDLISRSALLKNKVFMCGGFVSDQYAQGYMEALDAVEEAINNAQTAFDLDAVVERLEEESSFFEGKPMGTLQKHYYCEGIKRAIEIVKGLYYE